MAVHRPTLADVARLAQVSVSTASLAFSGAGPVAPATKARVLEAARTLDYCGPNPLGRQLRSGRSGIIGVIIGDRLRRSFRDPVSVQVLDGLASTLGELGLGVLLVPDDGSELDGGVDPLLRTAAMDVAVLIWGAHEDDARVPTLLQRGIPIVIGEGNPIDDFPVIGIDDQSGFRDLVTSLAALGHRRFATITLPFGRHRRSGWVGRYRPADVDWAPTKRRLAGLFEAGVDVVGIYETEASLVENGKAAALEILDPARVPADERPTVIVAQSDLLAAGAILAARELGLRVPEDISIAGFDGIDLPWLSPDVLTTVRQPLAAKGAAIGRAVEQLLATGSAPSRMLSVELVPGTTTGPPPSL